MTSQTPLYIGFDLSTQQLKGLVVNSDLKVEYLAKFDFDADSTGFPIKKGVMTNEAEHEVYAPVALWLQALDTVLSSLRQQGLDFSRVKGISGAGQQHGSVYWGQEAESMLKNLDPAKSLENQLEAAFSHPYSPNWQDSSTQKECDEFDSILGGQEQLAQATGSKAHHVRISRMFAVDDANPAIRDSQVPKSSDSKGSTPRCTRRPRGSPWCLRSSPRFS
jgi:xylulokinase